MDVAIFADTEELTKTIEKLKIKLKSIKGASKTFGDILGVVVFQDIINHFQDESGPDGKWKAWSNAYRKHMNSIGKGGNKILQDTGKLRQAIAPAKFKQVSGGYLWFNVMNYSGRHDRGENGMPERKFMWLSDDALNNIANQTLAFILDKS